MLRTVYDECQYNEGTVTFYIISMPCVLSSE